MIGSGDSEVFLRREVMKERAFGHSRCGAQLINTGGVQAFGADDS